MKSLAGLACSMALLLPVPATAATSSESSRDRDAARVEQLKRSAEAVVRVKATAVDGARSAKTLGTNREGSGVVIGSDGMVLTIGYLILEADSVEVTDHRGKTFSAVVQAYDHGTGFGLVKTVGKPAVAPVKLGTGQRVANDERLMIVSGMGDRDVSVASLVSRRPFAGYWEYAIDGALFTSPPRPDHSGAGLFNVEGELVGVGSLFVMDAKGTGERYPGNMFVPVDLLKPIMNEMLATGSAKGSRKPWLGINSAEDEGQIKVIRVSEESPAEAAGLQAGDVIVSVGATKVKSLAELYRAIWGQGSPGVEIPLTVMQDSQTREVKVKSVDRLEFLKRKQGI